MKCKNCPLFSTIDHENGAVETCAIFGGEWDSRFQYEDEQLAMIVGCYIEKAYIDKVAGGDE